MDRDDIEEMYNREKKYIPKVKKYTGLATIVFMGEEKEQYMAVAFIKELYKRKYAHIPGHTIKYEFVWQEQR
jgi:hypothetical protein